MTVDNSMNKQTTLEDEEALDPIDDIWQATLDDDEAPVAAENKTSFKIRGKLMTKPYVAYEPLRNNCDSLKTWSVACFRFKLKLTWAEHVSKEKRCKR